MDVIKAGEQIKLTDAHRSSAAEYYILDEKGLSATQLPSNPDISCRFMSDIIAFAFGSTEAEQPPYSITLNAFDDAHQTFNHPYLHDYKFRQHVEDFMEKRYQGQMAQLTGKELKISNYVNASLTDSSGNEEWLYYWRTDPSEFAIDRINTTPEEAAKKLRDAGVYACFDENGIADYSLSNEDLSAMLEAPFTPPKQSNQEELTR